MTLIKGKRNRNLISRKHITMNKNHVSIYSSVTTGGGGLVEKVSFSMHSYYTFGSSSHIFACRHFYTHSAVLRIFLRAVIFIAFTAFHFCGCYIYIIWYRQWLTRFIILAICSLSNTLHPHPGVIIPRPIPSSGGYNTATYTLARGL